jgi:hypothetical protein
VLDRGPYFRGRGSIYINSVFSPTPVINVPQLLEKRKNASNLVEYKVSWDGYGSEENTWSVMAPREYSAI